MNETMKEIKYGIIHTGLVDIDSVLGGWRRGELTIIGGRPSIGKSAFIQSLTLQAARRGTRTLLFSPEMKRDVVISRMISDMVWSAKSQIPYKRIRDYDLTEYEIERIERATEKFAEAPIRIDDKINITVADIAARSRRYVDEMNSQGKRVDVIAIDRLSRVVPSDRYIGNPVKEEGEKVIELSNLGKELDVHVIATSQLGRKTENRCSFRPEISDLWYSSDLETEPDVIILLHRVSYYIERLKEDDLENEFDRLRKLDICKNTIEVIIAKNRNGPIANIEFFCDIASNVIMDMVR